MKTITILDQKNKSIHIYPITSLNSKSIDAIQEYIYRLGFIFSEIDYMVSNQLNLTIYPSKKKKKTPYEK